MNRLPRDPDGPMGDTARDNGIDRPIFVVGVDHSGTSILYRIMARHPELAWLSQYSLRDGTLPGRGRVPLAGWINRTGRRLSGFTWRKRHRLLRPEPREAVGVWRRLIPKGERPLSAEDYTDETAERVRSTIGAELRAWRMGRIIFKTPYLTRTVAVLGRIFPSARFVHIVRDGRAVALSTRTLFARKTCSPEDALRAAAVYWAETVEYLDSCARCFEARFLTVPYEELCADMHSGINQAWRFCGLPPAPKCLSDVPTTLRPTNGRWIDGCAEEDQKLLDEALGATLAKWGYAPFRGVQVAS